MYKGVGHLFICKHCVEQLYQGYLAQCNNAKDAVRQMCRKLDLYWSEKAFDYVAQKGSSRSIMSLYITRINIISCAGKSYDDTLADEGTLWSFRATTLTRGAGQSALETGSGQEAVPEIPDDVIAFWGEGFPPEMYLKFEQRKAWYMSRFAAGTEIDVGTEGLIRQVCMLEVTIAKDVAEGKSIDKGTNAYNNLIGSLKLKPAQQKSDSDATMENTPFGVWIRRWEEEQPIPEIDPQLQDVDGLIKYILTWVYGHTAKMLGVKNCYSKLYEAEIARLRVDYPEYADEDDDALLFNVFGGTEGVAPSG